MNQNYFLCISVSDTLLGLIGLLLKPVLLFLGKQMNSFIKAKRDFACRYRS